VLAWAVLAVAGDRLTKSLVARAVPAGGRPVFARSWLEIRPVGHAFSTGRKSALPLLILYGIVLSGLMLVIHLGLLFQPPAARAGLGLAMGGATSNLYDRVRHGRVINFVRLAWWPAFNLADIAICLGAAVALLRLHT
jgi:signal peptidase II